MSSLRYVVEADGGSRGNPGVAGYGAVVRDAADDLVLAERAEHIGTATNNVAEYRGLIAGLQAARELGITEVEVRLDSKLVVEQMAGRWKIKNQTLQPLALQARRLLDEFDRVELRWIPRAQNTHADRLANEAMDGAGRSTTTSPSGRTAAEAVDRVEDRTASDEPTSLLTAHPGPAPALSMLLLRHGETEQSLERRFSGRTDLPLTAKGELQAQAAATRIAAAEPIDVIVSSPLQRARQTAQAVAEATGLRVKVDDELREVDFGDWEGLTFAEASRAGGSQFTAWGGNPDVAPPGGESQSRCLERVAGVRNRLLREHRGKRVLLVTHVTPIKVLLGEALGGLRIPSRINLDLASISRIDYHDGRVVVKLVNEISHLGVL